MVGPAGRGRGWWHPFCLEHVRVGQQECKSVAERVRRTELSKEALAF